MLFYDPLFLFAFLPAIFGAYLLARWSPGLRLPILLLASLLFYAWGEAAFVPVVVASALLDYALGRAIMRGARWAMPIGVAANLALLVTYKYLGFLATNLAPVLGTGMVAHLPAFALPIGVSFIVFEKITYLVDIARGRSAPAAGFAQYLNYVLFFPKLLAGPIIKYHDIDAQFRAPPAASSQLVLDGFLRFMMGVVKKLLVADILGNAADAVFAVPSGDLGCSDAWWGAILFSLQIYLDFSAYSDMAIGLAAMFGFCLRENFDMPYIACSMTEFWRRWHMSLTSWIREYLYIPLGGNRAPTWRVYVNLWLCFLASGLWHGAAWTYLAWGTYNGLFLVLDRWFLLRWLDRLPRVAANGAALVIIVVGWVLFRAASLTQAAEFLGAMTHPGHWGGVIEWRPDTKAALAAGVVISLGPRLVRVDRLQGWARASAASRFAVETAALLLFTVAVSKAVAEPFRPFLYFRF